MPNDVKLQNSIAVDENLRPLSVGGKSTAIETAQYGNGARVNGDLEVTGNIIGNITDLELDLTKITSTSDLTITAADALYLVSGSTVQVNNNMALGSGKVIYFDSTDTKIGSNADDPEDMVIEADQDILMSPDASLVITPGTVVTIDKDYSDTTAAEMTALHIDFDRTGDVSEGIDRATGLDIDVNSTGASGGLQTAHGLDIDVVTDTGAGANTAIGATITVSGGDTNIGLSIINQDGGTDFVNASSANVSDYFKINTIAAGATTLTTVDTTVGTTAHLNLDADGDITLNSASGNFIAEKGGTEFSVANSAYAGMIVGYTRLQGNLTTQGNFEIQNSITVEDDTHQITFKTPPSELVEIEATFWINFVTTSASLNVGLSDQSAAEGYQSVGVEYEYDAGGHPYSDGEADDGVYTIKWIVGASDLEAVGSSNTFYIGFSTAGVTKSVYLVYGVRATHSITAHPFVIKATALPATVYDGL